MKPRLILLVLISFITLSESTVTHRGIIVYRRSSWMECVLEVDSFPCFCFPGTAWLFDKQNLREQRYGCLNRKLYRV